MKVWAPPVQSPSFGMMMLAGVIAMEGMAGTHMGQGCMPYLKAKSTWPAAAGPEQHTAAGPEQHTRVSGVIFHQTRLNIPVSDWMRSPSGTVLPLHPFSPDDPEAQAPSGS